MKKLLFIKLFVLLLMTATLSGCHLLPPGFGHHHGGGHDNGHHDKKGHDRD